MFNDFDPPQSLDAPSWFAERRPCRRIPSTGTSIPCSRRTPATSRRAASARIGRSSARVATTRASTSTTSPAIRSSPIPNDYDFCAPENINVDFPPKKQWIRVGVHYYSSHGKPYDVHPTIKIFCDGALTAELGAKGYYDPESPITFTPTDGAKLPGGNRFWIVADVAFRETDQCGAKGCVVKPIYSDPGAKTPLFTYDDIAETTFGPGYPPPP